MKNKVLIIIVTHNSETHIQWCVNGLSKSNSDITFRIVDSGSKNTDYLEVLNEKNNVLIIKESNIGFVAGNNRALYDIDDFDWVLFLNPDARIESDDFDRLIAYASKYEQEKVGLFTVPLIRFDIQNYKSLNCFDSVGIRCNYYGRWQDILSNSPVRDIEKTFTEVDAVCGAFMLFRVKALMQCVDSTNTPGFERMYYMYKEDIELSQRVIKFGWKVGVYNKVTAFHCRGWNDARNMGPYWARWHSAKNDVDVSIKYKWRAFPLAIAKYFWVRFLERK